MSALTAARVAKTNDAKLLAAQATCQRWVNAAKGTTPGPLWKLLDGFVDDALVCGLRDVSFVHRVKLALRLLKFVRQDKDLSEREALTPKAAKRYQRYIARLRKERSVQPASPQGPGKPKPLRRAAAADEDHLEEGTQRLYVSVIRHLWRYAHDQDIETDLEIGDLDPTGRLMWRDRHEKPRDSIDFTLEALYATPFVRARGRSIFEFLRDLMLATVYACCPTRNTEVREATWRGAQVWEVEPGRAKPLRVWPIEAALTGEVRIDDERFVVFITVGDIDATKSDEHRRIPLVGMARERFIAYARAWVDHQILSLTYLRYRSRRHLAPALRKASLRTDDLALMIGGKVLTSALMRSDPKAWHGAAEIKGQGYLRIRGGTPKKLDLKETQSIRTLIWADGAALHYKSALAAFDQNTPIKDVFVGTLFPSREGGVISGAQQGKIWRDHGWTAKDWLPKKLRQNAVQRYENERRRVLSEIGRIAGHRSAQTTLDHYANHEPWLMAQVCLTTEAAVRRPGPRRPSNAALSRAVEALAALTDDERRALVSRLTQQGALAA